MLQPAKHSSRVCRGATSVATVNAGDWVTGRLSGSALTQYLKDSKFEFFSTIASNHRLASMETTAAVQRSPPKGKRRIPACVNTHSRLQVS